LTPYFSRGYYQNNWLIKCLSVFSLFFPALEREREREREREERKKERKKERRKKRKEIGYQSSFLSAQLISIIQAKGCYSVSYSFGDGLKTKFHFFTKIKGREKKKANRLDKKNNEITSVHSLKRVRRRPQKSSLKVIV